LNSFSSYAIATLKKEPSNADDVIGALSPAFSFPLSQEKPMDKLAQLVNMQNTDHGMMERVGEAFVWELAAKSWTGGSSRSESSCNLDGVESVGVGCNGHMCFVGKCMCSDSSTSSTGCTNPSRETEWCLWGKSLENAVLKKGEVDLQFAEYDRCNFYNAEYGITHVSKSRWTKAQSFEAGYHVGKKEDRQDVHTAWFRRYSSIRGVQLGNVLEIGAGAFTQTRVNSPNLYARPSCLLVPLSGNS
jgi:hypothetical protein